MHAFPFGPRSSLRSASGPVRGRQAVGRLVVMAGLAPMLGGCPKDGASAELQRGFEVASQRAAMAEEAMQAFEERVASLEALLRDGGGPGDDVVTDLAATKGAIEEVRFAVDTVGQDFEAYQLDQERRLLWAEQRLASLEQLLGVQPPPPPCVGPPEQCPPATTPTATGGGDTGAGTVASTTPTTSVGGGTTSPAPGDRIALARQRMDAGQQAAARAILESMLQKDPQDARAAEIRYRIGETWFNEGRYRQAARAFRDVTDQHASSQWAPWALLRSGECFEGMGHADDARVFYQSILQSYPASDAAVEAKRRLKK